MPISFDEAEQLEKQLVSEQNLTEDQMIPNSQLMEVPSGYQTPQPEVRPTAQIVEPRSGYAESNEFIKPPEMEMTEELMQKYEEGRPNFEMYRPLIDEMSIARKVDPDVLQKFLDEASTEERANLIKAINYNQDFDVLGREIEQKFPEEEGLGTYQEFDALFTPLAGRMSKEVLEGAAEAFRMRGLSPALKRALQSGDEDTLRRVIQEMQLSKELGIGDEILKTPKSGRSTLDPGDLTTNKVEQRRFTDEANQIAEKATPLVKGRLRQGTDMETTANLVGRQLQDELKKRKSEVGSMYEAVKAKADPDKLYDTTVLNDKLRKYMQDEGMESNAISSVLKLLEPSGKALTTPQKMVKKELDKTRRALQSAEGRLLRQDTPANRRRTQALKKKVDKLEGQTEEFNKYISERDMVNLVQQINKKMRTGNINLPDDPATNRILQGVKSMFIKDAENLLKLNKREGLLKDLQKAGKAYHEQVVPFEEVPEISMLSQGSGLSDEVMSNLIKNPYRMKAATKLVSGTEAGENLAEQMVRQATRDVEQHLPGAKETIDFTKTSNQLENLWKDPEMLKFMKESLPKDQFASLQALQGVLKKAGPMFDDLRKLPDWQQYINQGEGPIGKLGRAVETLYDYAGYLKNSTIGKVPGLKWTSSRAKISNDKIDRVVEIAERKLKELQEGKIDYKDIAKSLTEQEEQALDDFNEYFGGMVKTLGKSAKSQIEQATK